MSSGSAANEGDGIRPLDVVASITVLFVLALAQPLLDLLGRNAEFFLARSAPPLDIVLLAVALTLVIPLTIGFFIVGVRHVHEPTGRLLHGLVLASLAGVLVLQLIELLPLSGLSPWLELAFALAAGAALAVAFYRFASMRSAAKFASVAPFVVLGLFLFASSASQLVFASSAIAQPAQIAVGNPAPVVMVILDEFPIASLMDESGKIQESLYPGFAKLSRDGTWFSNAVTIQQQTENSIPAILTGKNPAPNKIPTAGDHPFNLFTLLADSYDLKVIESVTDLCPEYACENTTRPEFPARERWATLVDDLRVVAGHLFLPAAWTKDLPSIDSSWSNFSGGESGNFDIIERFQEATYEDGRIVSITQFSDSISSSDDVSTLYYLHALLPHVPWEYLPSGQKTVSSVVAPGSVSPGWGSDEWLVDQGYQRHLLQVGYADKVVVELIEHLESQGIYDDALVVIMADHGVAVRPDIYHRRWATDDTIGDIAAIPLFIKRPHQDNGGADHYRAETVDVLPTIADVLDIEVPWTMDGASLFSDDRPERLQSQIAGAEGVIVFGVDGSEALALAARKIEHFGSDGPFGLAPPGHADLVGVQVESITVEDTGIFSARLFNGDNYQDVDLDAPALPTWVRGLVTPPEDAYSHLIVAVAVNGEVAAITRTLETDRGETAFGMMIPADSLRSGDNDITLLLIETTNQTRTFHSLTN
jgi:hypothetical protein